MFSCQFIAAVCDGRLSESKGLLKYSRSVIVFWNQFHVLFYYFNVTNLGLFCVLLSGCLELFVDDNSEKRVWNMKTEVLEPVKVKEELNAADDDDEEFGKLSSAKSK